jgi:hypothetical protein
MGYGGSELRAIFLDFDGVTHPVSAIADWRSLTLHGPALQKLVAERKLFRWLPYLEQALADHHDVMIVVHSAWRKFLSNSELRQVLGPLQVQFVGVTPHSDGSSRVEGIEAMASRMTLDHYLVIDDAIDEFPAQYPRLLLTEPEIGLKDQNVLDGLTRWLIHSAPSPSDIGIHPTSGSN